MAAGWRLRMSRGDSPTGPAAGGRGARSSAARPGAVRRAYPLHPSGTEATAPVPSRRAATSPGPAGADGAPGGGCGGPGDAAPAPDTAAPNEAV